MESYRKNAIEAFKTVLKIEKNIIIIEKNIFNSTKEKFSHLNEEELEDIYIYIVYQIIGDIQQNIKLKEILKNIKDMKIYWEHHSFQDLLIKLKEQNDFIENPFEVEEGIFECRAVNPKTSKICGSKRVFSYAKQDRSCDEGTSVYCECVKCGAKWRERG